MMAASGDLAAVRPGRGPPQLGEAAGGDASPSGVDVFLGPPAGAARLMQLGVALDEVRGVLWRPWWR